MLIVAYMDSKIRFLGFLAAYCYDIYFSIIVLKVGLKLIEILRNKINFQNYRKIVIGTFVGYEVLLFASLVF